MAGLGESGQAADVELCGRMGGGVQEAKAREKERSRVQELEAERTQHIPTDAKRHAAVDHVSHLLDASPSTAVAAVSAAAPAARRKNMPSVPKPAKKRPAPVGQAPASSKTGSSGQRQKPSGECVERGEREATL